MTFPKELKEAISLLPSKEKDKLIFRLLRRDLPLANRLLFELVSEVTVEEQRAAVKENLKIKIERSSNNYYSPSYLNIDVRSMSAEISEHLFTTKDKFGEISLNLYLINSILEKNKKNILSATPGRADKFCIPAVARVFKILLLINKLHEDYFLEFRDDLEKLGQLIIDNPYLAKTAIHHGLDVNWLLSGEIPSNIEQIYKAIRAEGLLK